MKFKTSTNEKNLFQNFGELELIKLLELFENLNKYAIARHEELSQLFDFD